MPEMQDLKDRVFGRYTVIEFGFKRKGNYYWKCRCSCPDKTEKYVSYSSLMGGKTVSCGCHKREKALRHGQYGTKTYHVWNSMLQRCNNPNDKKYPRYGGRGIKVCESWHKFENFYADIGGDIPKGLTIERKDSNGNYEPDNVKLATYKEQNNNTSQNNVISFNGLALNITQWAEKLGINAKTLSARIVRRKWSIERALTEPVGLGRREPVEGPVYIKTNKYLEQQ